MHKRERSNASLPPHSPSEETRYKIKTALDRCGWTFNAFRGMGGTHEKQDIIAHIRASALVWGVVGSITTAIPYASMIDRTMAEVVEEYFDDDLSKEEQQLLDIVIGCVRVGADNAEV